MSFSQWRFVLPLFDDELLSSWLCRNAFYVHLSPFKFCEYVSGTGRIWYQDLDRTLPEECLGRLSDASGVDILTLKTHQLYGQITNGNHVYSGILPFLLANGSYHQNRKQFSQQFCPDCLEVQCYIRKAWRFGYEVYCPVHYRQLRDRCPECGSKFMPHRNKLMNMITCAVCNANLALSDNHEPGQFDHDIFELQLALASSDARRNYGSTSLDLIETGRILMSFCHYSALQKKHLVPGIEVISARPYRQKNNTFELQSIQQRLVMLKMLAFMMKDFPVRFLNYCARYNLSRAFFMSRELPDSLAKVVSQLPLPTYHKRPVRRLIPLRFRGITPESINTYKNRRSKALWTQLATHD